MAMLATVITAFAWGQKGHDVTAAIAERHLTPATRAAVDSLLSGRSMVYWANWMDNASNTPAYAYSKTWHYKNVDANEAYASAKKNPAGDVVTAIEQQIAALKDPATKFDDKQLALKILVHTVGDIHQPMHMGHLSDLGGNKWKVSFFTTPTNLHSVWDGNVVESGHKWSYTEWADQIDRYTGNLADIIGGTPNDWGEQTWQVATKVYMSSPENSTLSYDYIAEWTPIVEDQLLRGGLRLAHLLNTIFDTSYTGRQKLVMVF